MGRKPGGKPQAATTASRPGRNPVADAQSRLKTFADGSSNQGWTEF
jgi:hypothetical protein